MFETDGIGIRRDNRDGVVQLHRAFKWASPSAQMNPIALPLICGVGFGALAVALMIPMSFPNKRTRAYAPILAMGVVGGAIIGVLVTLTMEL